MVNYRSIIFSLALLLPCSSPAAGHSHGAQAGVLSLDVYAGGGRIHLLTGESRNLQEKPVLLHRSSADGGENWSAPVRVDAGLPAPYGLRRGMDAQIAAAGPHLIAAWTTAGTDRWGSGPLATAISSDGGKTWIAGVNPADDGSTTGHGFIDLATDADGTFHLTWLDSRDGRQGLRYARSTDHGKAWSANTTVKPATCECCSNSFAIGADGLTAILFRDGNPRDMHVAISGDAGANWSKPVRAGQFDWEFNGCPHVGGGVAIGPGPKPVIHSLVWTGKDALAGVYHVSSDDRGSSWSKPIRLGGESASHPDLATGGSGLAAVWDESASGVANVHAARSTDGGKSWGAPQRLSNGPNSATHPRIIAGPGDRFRAFWTEAQDDGTIALRHAAIAPLD